MNPAPSPEAERWARRWQQLSSAFLRAFHRYASWLVSITWKRFVLLSVALMIVAAILPKLPPFSWSVTETIEDSPSSTPSPKPPKTPRLKLPSEPPIKIEKPASGAGKTEGLDISIDARGIRIVPRPASAAASGAKTTSYGAVTRSESQVGRSFISRSTGIFRPARIEARARRIAATSTSSSSISGCGSSTTKSSFVPSGNFAFVTTLPLTTFARAVRIGA